MSKDIIWSGALPTIEGAYWCLAPGEIEQYTLLRVITAIHPVTKDELLAVEFGDQTLELCNQFFAGHIWYGPLEDPPPYVLHS